MLVELLGVERRKVEGRRLMIGDEETRVLWRRSVVSVCVHGIGQSKRRRQRARSKLSPSTLYSRVVTMSTRPRPHRFELDGEGDEVEVKDDDEDKVERPIASRSGYSVCTCLVPPTQSPSPCISHPPPSENSSHNDTLLLQPPFCGFRVLFVYLATGTDFHSSRCSKMAP